MKHSIVAFALLIVLFPALFLVSCSDDDPTGAGEVTLRIVPNLSPALQGQNVLFEASYSGAQLDAPRYEWDFGDGLKTTVYDIKDVWHIYESPGDYTITLEVYDDVAGSKHTSGSVAIAVLPYSGGMSITPDSLSGAPQLTQFSFTCAYTGTDVPNPVYSWDFGDGTGKQTSQTPGTMTHTYYKMGEFTVTCSLYENGNLLRDAATAKAVVTNKGYLEILPPDHQIFYRMRDTIVAVYTGPQPRIGSFKWYVIGGTSLTDNTTSDTSYFPVTFYSEDEATVRVELSSNTYLYDAISVMPNSQYPAYANTITATLTGAFVYKDSTIRTDGGYNIFSYNKDSLIVRVTSSSPFGAGAPLPWKRQFVLEQEAISGSEYMASFSIVLSPDATKIESMTISSIISLGINNNRQTVHAITVEDVPLTQEQFPEFGRYELSGSTLNAHIVSVRHDTITQSIHDPKYRSQSLSEYAFDPSSVLRIDFKFE